MPGGDEAGVAEGVDGLAVVELVVADGDGVVRDLADDGQDRLAVHRGGVGKARALDDVARVEEEQVLALRLCEVLWAGEGLCDF